MNPIPNDATTPGSRGKAWRRNPWIALTDRARRQGRMRAWGAKRFGVRPAAAGRRFPGSRFVTRRRTADPALR